MKDITAIILTYNEQLHIERCIRSLAPLSRRIVVVDSHSTDATVDIARAQGADVYQHAWTNYATQSNWALDHCDIDTCWTMRIDADEYVTAELAEEIDQTLDLLPEDVTGVSVPRRVVFMNRPLRHGALYPVRLLRIWRTGMGRCEKRWMDEHIRIASGRIIPLHHDIVDENLNNLTWWINKHNGYATREALDVLIHSHLPPDDPAQIDTRRGDTTVQALRQRWLKVQLYYHVSPYLRTWCYFFYRYFLRLGLLDGRPGMIFHMMQGLWYRTLVDAKIREIEQLMHARKLDLRQAILQHWNINL